MQAIFDFISHNIPPLFWIYLGLNILMGIINLILFIDDKFSSMGDPETMGRTTVFTLLCLPAIGGAWGPLVVMKKWRHKTTKKYFKFTYFCELAIHICVFLLIFIKGV